MLSLNTCGFWPHYAPVFLGLYLQQNTIFKSRLFFMRQKRSVLSAYESLEKYVLVHFAPETSALKLLFLKASINKFVYTRCHVALPPGKGEKGGV